MRVNWVSLLFLVTIVGTGYAAYKFVPIYYTSYKVDEILSDIAAQSSGLAQDPPSRSAQSARRLREKASDRIGALGIADPQLTVAFESNYTVVTARYVVVVSHPFGKTTVLEFERSAKVP